MEVVASVAALAVVCITFGVYKYYKKTRPLRKMRTSASRTLNINTLPGGVDNLKRVSKMNGKGFKPSLSLRDPQRKGQQQQETSTAEKAWVKVHCEASARDYYYNQQTGATQWTAPHNFLGYAPLLHIPRVGCRACGKKRCFFVLRSSDADVCVVAMAGCPRKT